jgi:hypothetical protein
MTRREKTLVGAVTAAGLLWFGTQGLGRYRAAREQNINQQIEAERALSEANAAVNRGQHARRQLNRWNRRSLPTNVEIAESLYQDWLRGQLTDAGLQVTQLADKSGSGRNPQFGELSFDVRAEGTLDHLTKFLYQFYSAVHLHRISSATLAAAEGGQKLSITLTVDALILPGSDRTDKLPEGEPQPMAAPMEELQKRIVDRNLFTAYTAKTGDSPGSADAAASTAKITGAIYGLGGWTMFVRAGESSDLRQFQIGDTVEYGKFKGKVLEIENRRAVIETDKGRVEVRVGQSFADAVELPSPAA